MDYTILQYELKTKELLDKWDAICLNKIEFVKQTLSKRPFNTVSILIKIKKIFNVTPQSLKTQSTDKAKYLKPFAILLAIRFSSASDDLIMSDFNITAQALEEIKNDATIETVYSKEILAFYEYHKNDILTNAYANIAFADEILTTIDCEHK